MSTQTDNITGYYMKGADKMGRQYDHSAQKKIMKQKEISDFENLPAI